MPPILELRNVTKSFGRVQAVRGANFTLEPGQIHALLGDNGAGKSTLVKIMQGYHAPTSGTVMVQDQPAQFTSPAEARRAGIETVPQDLGLVSLMSIYRNFFLGREQTKALGFLDHQAMRTTCTEALARFGISIRNPDEAVGQLSGGERQAIAIARAEHFGAKVVILDEPTSALSVKQTQRVLDYILDAKSRGLAIVFITHNMYHAQSVADRATVMRRGQSVAENQDMAELTAEDLGHLVMGA